MSLPDLSTDEDLSSDEEEVPIKRSRVDTYASTTSHDSAESDDEAPQTSYSGAANHKNRIDQSPEGNIRLSRSSSSENEPRDYYKPSFDDSEADEAYPKPSFQMDDNLGINRNSDCLKEMDEAFQSKYSEQSKIMMANMGYKLGQGLGKLEDGRVEPVEASTQKGRRGLGMKPSVVGDVPTDFSWTPDTDTPIAKEEVVWMPSPPEDILTGDVLQQWLKIGPKRLTMEDEHDFVEPNIFNGVLNAKSIFDKLHDDDMRNARTRSNPYETIGSVIFMNRAAVKMANIDAVFDYMFTEPKKPDGDPVINNNEILYFADVCAGPGGFSEYVLYRKGWRAKGFGFTLRSSNNFKLSDFYAGTPETFYPYYGANEDGNIYDPANLTSLKDYVLSRTDDKGVHFLMADGGFSVEAQENLQEVLSKQLYLCQCLAALMLVRTGGNFVVKLFDVFTPFSVGLIYIMYRCFEKVCIHKPVTSRPANSERYLVCKWKKLGTESVEQHLFSVNSILWSALDASDVVQLVPLEVMQKDTGFYEYIYKSNCILGERQIKNLLKIAAFSKDKNLKENTQAEMRAQCLKLWEIPDRARTPIKRLNHEDTLSHILSCLKNPTYRTYNKNSFKSNALNKPPVYLEGKSNLELFNNIYDWHFTFLSNGKNKNRTIDKDMNITMFIGCGGKQVYQLKNNTWDSVDVHFDFPAKTLIYGEVIKEYVGEKTRQTFNRALHIIDAIMLGGIDISSEPLTQRIKQCALFCEALENSSNNLQLRCKRFFSMDQFPNAVRHLDYRIMKRGNRAVAIEIPKRNNIDDTYYVVGSVLFIREIKEPWSTHVSKKSGNKYYFRFCKDEKPVSDYEIRPEAALDAITAYMQRVMWPWDVATEAVFEGQTHQGVSRADMEGFVEYKTTKS